MYHIVTVYVWVEKDLRRISGLGERIVYERRISSKYQGGTNGIDALEQCGRHNVSRAMDVMIYTLFFFHLCWCI